jgi:ABC-type transporter Mla subunit MlaD
MRRALVAALAVLAVIALIVFGSGAGGDGGGDYKVRAIFDNASFLIPGQDVKVAGAKVGVVESLDVQTQSNGTSKAAVVMRIDTDGFKDFHTDAHCAIRLQSVIGEKLVECTPSQPGSTAPLLQPLPKGQPGAGQRLLPVENTSTPVDADLINNIQRRPFRERFSILLNELGAGLAARADDIKVLVRRANPALREFDQFLAILAGQNKMLGQLTKNADTVITTLSKKRRELADFFVQSGIAAEATAEKRVDLERNFQKFPAFLRELRPFMERFDALSTQMAPVISDLRASAPDVSRILVALGPFSKSSTGALKTLGNTADVGREALANAKPVADRLATFTSKARPVVSNLAKLLSSVQQHNGVERFVDVLYYVALSTNGFDAIGHYLRNNLVVTICSGYSLTPTIGCSANFQGGSASAAASSTAPQKAIASTLIKMLGGSPQHHRKRKSNRTRSKSKSKSKSKSQPTRTAGDTTPKPTGPSGPSGTTGPSQGTTSPSPGTPAPTSPATVEKGSGDPLLEYYLGGTR